MNFNDVHVDTLLRWEKAPIEFVREHFNVEPDPFQKQVLTLWGSEKPIQRISMQACVGPGKSAVEAWCTWHGMATKGDAVDKPNGFAVSITGDNLRDNYWKELAKWQAQSPLLEGAFTLTATRLFATGYKDTWFLGARSWPKTANADEQGKTLSGLHSRYVFVILDESGAIPVPVLRAGDQALSSCGWGRLLQGGNPLSLDGVLYAAATTYRGLWDVIRITGDPDDPEAWVNAPRAMAQHREAPDCGCPRCWAKQQIETLGRDNPWVQAYILGRFPSSSLNTLFSVEEVEAALCRHYGTDDYGWAQKRIGVDVARFGDDRTVLFPRQGLAAFKPVVMRGARTGEIAARIAHAAARWQPESVLIDDTGGYGAGVIDSLLTSKATFGVVPVNASGSPSDRRYANLRAECWFAMADWVKRGGALADVPRDIVAELTQPTYTFSGGRFQLEPKDHIKKRLGRSPDLADALAQTFAMPDQPADLRARLAHASRADMGVPDEDRARAILDALDGSRRGAVRADMGGPEYEEEL